MVHFTETESFTFLSLREITRFKRAKNYCKYINVECELSQL